MHTVKEMLALEFLEKPQSKVWQKAMSAHIGAEKRLERDGQWLKEQNGWHAVRVVRRPIC